MKTKTIARNGLLIALAMLLSYLESKIPAFIAVPGVKIGLANIVVVFALYRIDLKSAILISLLRVFLCCVLFGSVLSMAYSFAGAVVSLTGMALLKKTKLFGTVGVSVAGGVLHNLGQIGVACLILRTDVIAYYIPFLLFSGTVAGVVIGLAGAVVIERVILEND